jgi:hypothetical protein
VGEGGSSHLGIVGTSEKQVPRVARNDKALCSIYTGQSTTGQYTKDQEVAENLRLVSGYAFRHSGIA